MKRDQIHHKLMMACTLLWALGTVSCRDDFSILYPEVVAVDQPMDSLGIQGMYLLNEGNMGSNKSTLDYYDLTTGQYIRNIYNAANPTIPLSLGDVGNDLAIYGDRLYAVINCSNKVEVMDKRTAKHLGQIEIPNCRYICFEGPYAYVSSFAGPVTIDPHYKQRGYVARVDTATLEVLDTCVVGFQPEEMEITNGKLYVANSGGYMVPNYEYTVSVVDLESFQEVSRIPVAINLHHLRLDRYGQLWVSSRGDYYGASSKLYCVDTHRDLCTDSLDVSVGNFCLMGDSLYILSSEWSYNSMGYDQATYSIVDVRSHLVRTTHFITDGTDERIQKPYGIQVNPATRDIYVTDARSHVNPGTLYCFSPRGKLKWSVRTGDIPAHMAFLYQKKEEDK